MSVREETQISLLILLISAVAWVVLLVSPVSTMSHAQDDAHLSGTDSRASLASGQMPLAEHASSMSHAHHAGIDTETSQATSLGASAMKPLPAQMAGWALMLVAMMSPTLIPPIFHIIERSFKRRRGRSVMLFVIGYLGIWMAAGVLLIVTTVMLRAISQSYLLAVGIGLIAVVWQCSPVKQRCLNRGHNHRSLAAFGITADFDVLRFGITHGYWCIGSCWLLMLLPMMMPYGHIAAMAVVSIVMIGERLEAPQSLSWRLRPSGTLMRMLVAQTQIQWQRALPRKLC